MLFGGIFSAGIFGCASLIEPNGGGVEDSSALDVGGEGGGSGEDAGGGISGGAIDVGGEDVGGGVTGESGDTSRTRWASAEASMTGLSDGAVTLSGNSGGEAKKDNSTSSNGNNTGWYSGWLKLSSSGDQKAAAGTWIKINLSAEQKTAINNDRVSTISMTFVYGMHNYTEGSDNGRRSYVHVYNDDGANVGWDDTSAVGSNGCIYSDNSTSGVVDGSRLSKTVSITSAQLKNKTAVYILIYSYAQANKGGTWNLANRVAEASTSVGSVSFTMTYNIPKITATEGANGTVTAAASKTVTAAQLLGTANLELDLIPRGNEGYYFTNWVSTDAGVTIAGNTYSAKPTIKGVKFYEVSGETKAVPLRADFAAVPDINPAITDYTYSGVAQGPTYTASGGMNVDRVSPLYKATGYENAAKPTDAGSYTYTALLERLSSSSYIVIGQRTFNFTILKKDMTFEFVVSGGQNGKTYDGTADVLDPDCYSVRFTGFVPVGGGGGANPQPAAGEFTLSAAYDAPDVGARYISATLIPGAAINKNFNINNDLTSTVIPDAEITKRQITFTVTPASKVYDGKSLTAYTLNFSNYLKPGGEEGQPEAADYNRAAAVVYGIDASHAEGGGFEVGTYTIKVTVAVNENGNQLDKNHEILNKTMASSTYTVSKKEVTWVIPGQAANKTYDGTNAYIAPYSLNFNGYVVPENTPDSGAAGSAAQPDGQYATSALYASKDAGSRAVTVTLSPVADSSLGRNYTYKAGGLGNALSQVWGTGTIEKKGISFSITGTGKTYDGNTDAGEYTITFNGYVNGSGEADQPVTSEYTVAAAYTDKNAGSKLSVSITNTTGDLLQNFLIPDTLKTVLSGLTIQKRTIDFNVDQTFTGKTYDGKADFGTVTVSFSNYVGDQPSGGYTVAAAYSSADAGDRTIITTLTIASGSDLDINYNVPTSKETETAYTISKAPISFIVTGAQGKQYDGTDKVPEGSYTLEFTGYVRPGGDAAQPDRQYTVSAVYSSYMVQEGVTLNVTVTPNADSDLLKNFAFTEFTVQSGTAVEITKRWLTVTPSLTQTTKVYDGTKAAVGAAVRFDGFVGTDGDGFISGINYFVSAEYADFTELSNRMPVHISLLLEDSDNITKNYQWEGNDSFITFYAGMTKRPLNPVLTVPDKEYDGEKSVTSYTLSFAGLVPHLDNAVTLTKGEDYTFIDPQFRSADAGENILVGGNFELLSKFEYAGFYQLAAGGLMRASVQTQANITKKVIGTVKIASAQYGDMFAGAAEADGADKDGKITGTIDWANYGEDVALKVSNGIYGAGTTYTFAGLPFILDSQWTKNYTADAGVETAVEVKKRKVTLGVQNPDPIIYNGEDQLAKIQSGVETGVNDGIDFSNYISIKSVTNSNADLISEAYRDKIVLVGVYTIEYEIIDPNDNLKNYDVGQIGENKGTIVIIPKELRFGSERSDGKLTITGAEDCSVKFTLYDGETRSFDTGIYEFEVNDYRVYKITAEMTGDDAFRYTAVVDESGAHKNLWVAIAVSAAEAAAAIAVGYGIYYLIAGIKKAKKAQEAFVMTKQASDAKRYAAYQEDVKRVNATKEARTPVQMNGIGANAAPKEVVKKPKYPTYAHKIDTDLVPRTVPKGYSPVLKNQAVPKVKGKTKK
jgi:hypothetical protein